MEPEKTEIAPLDFTSQLPDPLIHHIFSFLSPRDVANASVLSKNWNRAWCTYSYVAFHFIYSNVIAEQNQISDDLHSQRQKQDFLSVMQRSIYRRLKQEFHISRFQMYIDFPDIQFLAPYMDQWIGIAVGRSVPELALRVDSLQGGHRSHYNVLKFVMLAESLKVLSLSGCAFVNGIDFKLLNLQKLSLSHCRFPDEFSFQKIISGCPVIEYVKVSFCKLMDPLLVKGLPQLKCFEILLCGDVENVEIQASTLHKFSFAPQPNRWPRSINLSSCIALKELKLSGGVGDFALKSLISQLPALEVLELQRWIGSQDFRISSQKLKGLIFRDCRRLFTTETTEIDTPNLESLEFCNCDEPFIPVNASSEIKVHLVFSLRGNTVNFLIRLKDFLLKFCREDLKLILYNKSRDMIVHEKLSKVSFSSLCNFMHPKCICISSKSYTDLMDELFPIAYPETLFVIHSCDKLVKMVSEEMKNLRGHPKLLHKLLGFDVESYKDEEHKIDPATNVFIKAHTTGPYQTSKIILDWKYDVSNHRVVL